jgi:hypothetical protein
MPAKREDLVMFRLGLAAVRLIVIAAGCGGGKRAPARED